jgi:hypothetical protein
MRSHFSRTLGQNYPGEPTSPRPGRVAPFRRVLPLISGWPATRPPTPALAPECSSEHPGHPIDEHWREPNGPTASHDNAHRRLPIAPGPFPRDPGILRS